MIGRGGFMPPFLFYSRDMSTLFISDLHLCEERPQTTALFEKFITEVAPGSDALYILGDLFEYWVGDDQLDHDPLARSVAQSLTKLAQSGTQLYFVHGNRDFLIGERFAREARLKLLPDPTLIVIDGKTLLLMHGDTLCTDDVAYQQFRKQVRDPSWQRMILAKPFEDRLELARSIRSKSDIEKDLKSAAIMDVNQVAVKATIVANKYPALIHGHTHRPARHDLLIDSRSCTRWVLSDWHDSARVLIFPAASLSTISI
jgi:UDP-2,3-diacylglucosamine hydrolase